jgi:phage-related baseplate assembly protein
MRLEGLDELKNPITSSDTEPVTFRIAAQCLNQLRYRVSANWRNITSEDAINNFFPIHKFKVIS